MNPVELAEKLVKTLGDADCNTAHIALQIATLLLKHRDLAELQFCNPIGDSSAVQSFGDS